jgi:hypothetical protein
MASVDKTYTSSYSEYKSFKDWADKQYVTFFDGLKVCVGDYVWKLSEDMFDDYPTPIMNTPIWVDAYLIQNCTHQFVLDRMKEVHEEEYYNTLKAKDLGAKPSEEYQQNRNISFKKVIRNKRRLFPSLNKKVGSWLLRVKRSDYKFLNSFWMCNDITKVWSDDFDTLYPTNTNALSLESIEEVKSHLQKQYLPKGLEFTLTGIGVNINEDYLITIS